MGTSLCRIITNQEGMLWCMKSGSERVKAMMKELLECDKTKLIETLWECDPEIHTILRSSYDLHDGRNKMFDHLNGIERHLYNIYSDKSFKDMNLLEKNNSK